MFEVMTGEKEIRFSSRTRAGTDQFKQIQKLRHVPVCSKSFRKTSSAVRKHSCLAPSPTELSTTSFIRSIARKPMRAIPRIMCFCG
jgi:Patatin phospholipase